MEWCFQTLREEWLQQHSKVGNYRPLFPYRFRVLTICGPEYSWENSRDQMKTHSTKAIKKPRRSSSKRDRKITEFGTTIHGTVQSSCETLSSLYQGSFLGKERVYHASNILACQGLVSVLFDSGLYWDQNLSVELSIHRSEHQSCRQTPGRGRDQRKSKRS